MQKYALLNELLNFQKYALLFLLNFLIFNPPPFF